jgi:glycosyltransferase involved in cell wall biosynthesis
LLSANTGMRASPSISVIIPCYNAERYIAATIESVLAQDQPEMEIIVVDDGSTDHSADTVRRAFPTVQLELQANQGVAAARNRGISVARGEWVAFVDADDIWLPGKLSAQLRQLQAAPECRMNYTAWDVWPSDQPRPAADYLACLQDLAGDGARWDGPSGWIYPQLLLDCVVWTSTVLAQRSLLDELGGFDSSLHIGEDYDLWLRASRVTSILRIAKPYALYRIHPSSITKSMPVDNYRAKVIGRALSRWGIASPDGSLADQAAVQRSLAKSWSDFAGAHLQAGNLAQARRGGWASLRSSLGHVPAWKVLIKSYMKTLTAPPSRETK